MAPTLDGSENENPRLRELAILQIIREGGEAMRDEAFYLAKEDIKKDGDEMAAIQQLIRNYKDGLSAEALSRLKKESQDDAFIAAMLDVARDEMIKDVETQLIEELRPIIEQQLKAELMKDPEFIARVKAELKSIILGL